MISFWIELFIVGLIAGALARLLVPGRDPMGIFATALLGIVGSFVGGFLASLLFDRQLALRPPSFIGSVIGAVIALLIYRASVSRRTTTY